MTLPWGTSYSTTPTGRAQPDGPMRREAPEGALFLLSYHGLEITATGVNHSSMDLFRDEIDEPATLKQQKVQSIRENIFEFLYKG